MLMVLAHDDAPRGGRFWAALPVQGIGRALTREQAEALAAQTPSSPRFLFAYTGQSKEFGPPEGPAPTLAMLPGETIWHYGEPTRVDMLEVLRAVADGAESPDPESVLLPVDAVVARAVARFGETEAHTVETHFDSLVLDLGGRRVADPPAYLVPILRVVAG